jgi:O-antigen ligase
MTLLPVRNAHSLIAIIVSTGGLLILLNGAMGTNGNHVLTAALTFLPAVALFALGKFRNFTLNVIDVLFLTFVGCVGLSILANGFPPAKEALFFVATLFSYPACRFITLGESRWLFVLVVGAVVAAGATATAVALVSQWDHLDHPAVFGFSHAATVFLSCAGFLLILYASAKADWKVVLWLACPVAIFAASMVRFVFVAIVASLMVAAVTSPYRKRVLGMVAMVCISAAIGLAAHYEATGFQLRNVTRTTLECGENNNSLTIRRILFRDAIAAMPTAGVSGHGLAWFQSMSCVGAPPHNSFLQAIIEFGWLGGIAFVLLLATGIWRIWPLAIVNDEARFVLCCLICLAAISLVYGSLSHETLLFLFLGYAGRVNEQSSEVTVFKWMGLSRQRPATQTHSA